MILSEAGQKKTFILQNISFSCIQNLKHIISFL